MSLHLLPPEQRHVVLHQCRAVAQSLGAGLGQAASLQLAISVAGSPTAAAMLAAQVATFGAASSLLLAPSGASLSDRIGRKPCMILGVLCGATGVLWRLWELLWPWRQSALSFVVTSCALSAASAVCGGPLAELASLDDALAARPALSAAVSSRIGFWSGAMSLAGTVAGARLLAQGRRGAEPAAGAVQRCLSVALVFQICGLLLTCCLRETLPSTARRCKRQQTIATAAGRDHRSGGRVATGSINPVANLSLLLRNGARLRRLTLANVLFQLLNGNNALISTLALDQLKWTPADLSHFSAFQAGSDMIAQGFVLPALFLKQQRSSTNRADRSDSDNTPGTPDKPAPKPECTAAQTVPGGLQHRLEQSSRFQSGHEERAMQRAFLLGSVGSIASCLLMSQCWRPGGGRRNWRSAGVFVAAEGLRAGIGRACPATMRTMLLATALKDCSDVGVAELNAALLGMKTLCAGTNMAWVGLYRWCSQHGQPGGTWLIAAVGRCIVHAAVAGCAL